MKFSEELQHAFEATGFDPVALSIMLATAPRIFFIGNGGSAAIASHMAADFAKNGKAATMAFNDAAALTCLANDTGFENVFSAPLAQHITENDTLIAISSSGKSPNILAAVNVAREKSANIVTFSGFDPGNPLRKLGGMNIFVPSSDYGIVETMHLAMLHDTLREVVHARR